MGNIYDISAPSKGIAFDKMLTDEEVLLLLEATNSRRDGWRDHIIISLALATGLRLSEITALNFGDMWAYGADARRELQDLEARRVEARRARGLPRLSEAESEYWGRVLPREIVQLREFKRSNKDASQQIVVLNGKVRRKLARYRGEMARRGFLTAPEAPLFVSRQKNRIHANSMALMFERWCSRAGIDRGLTFHSLRHTAISAVLRATGNLRVAQKFARHASIQSTLIYAHPSVADMEKAVEQLYC
ncbi:MAG: tyrosine-type recombinase/integrase [Gammaproteobacteria bacterium]|nr:tyrosine-type recombinase/integrase [Gammaproteobacteria bacterium]